MPPLRPRRLGPVPKGLDPYHRDFLQNVKDAIDILVGAVKSQKDSNTVPESQVVIQAELDDDSVAVETVGSYSKSFMHMGAL